jgi:hypothetical protein
VFAPTPEPIVAEEPAEDVPENPWRSPFEPPLEGQVVEIETGHEVVPGYHKDGFWRTVKDPRPYHDTDLQRPVGPPDPDAPPVEPPRVIKGRPLQGTVTVSRWRLIGKKAEPELVAGPADVPYVKSA